MEDLGWKLKDLGRKFEDLGWKFANWGWKFGFLGSQVQDRNSKIWRATDCGFETSRGALWLGIGSFFGLKPA